MTPEQIYDRVAEILHEAFEIEPERIRAETRLYDDLDIDSIDAVDLIVRLKPLVGRTIKPEAFKSVRTVQDVVETIGELLIPS